jgi:ankyrin repeat protein
MIRGENNMSGSKLHLAVEKQDLDGLQRLLKLRLDPAIPDDDGSTPIMIAADKNYWGCVDAIVEYATKKDTDGYGYALILAMNAGKFQTALALIKNDASLNPHWAKKKESTSGYALHFAIYLKQNEVIAAILAREDADPDQHDESCPTPLQLAATLNNPEAVKLLFKAGADPTIADDDNKTPIMIAADKNHWDCVNTIVKHATKKDTSGYGYACILAMWAQKLPIALDLMQNDASLDNYHWENNSNGTSGNALHCAIYNKNNDILKAILARQDADPDQHNENCPTPLQLAATLNNPEAVKLLLKAGAKLALSDFDQKELALLSNLLLEAFEKNNIPLVLTLSSAGVTVDFSALSIPSTDEQWQCLRLLIGAALSEQLETVDWSHFYNAALEQKNERMQKELLLPQYGVDPLRAAFIRGDKTFVKNAVKDQGNHKTHQQASSSDEDPGTIDFARLPMPTTNAQWQCLGLFMEKTIQKKINTWPAFSHFYDAAAQQKNEDAKTFLLSPKFGIALSIEVAQSVENQKPKPSSSEPVLKKGTVLSLKAQENYWSKTEASARSFSGTFWVTPTAATEGKRPKKVIAPALDEIEHYFGSTL